MRGEMCGREEDVKRMVRSGAQDDALRAHAEACPVCGETLLVATWMLELAKTPADAAPLPDPTYLWYKAQLLRQWDAERQVLAPIEFWKRVQLMACIVGAAVVLVWLWMELPSLAAPGLNRVPWIGVAGVMTPVLVLSAVLLGGAAVVLVRDWVAGD